MNPMSQLLMETGLLQFGSFDDNGVASPFRLNLELLPAYPDVLKIITAKAEDAISEMKIERLVSASEAVPFGVALSLRLDIPLVYSRGSTDAPVFDLVGAYDIGHPALLLANVTGRWDTLSHLVMGARRVGLAIHSLLGIMDLGITQPPGDLQTLSILTLSAVVSELVSEHYVPLGQGQAVMEWIRRHNLHFNHRPGSIRP